MTRYAEKLNVEGYRSRGEITNVPSVYLVNGSHDCIIVDKEKVASRKGYKLLGSAKTKNKGHNGSYDWETNRNFVRSVRVNTAGDLDAYYNSAWYSLATFTAGSRLEFAPWWDATEEIDELLFVDNETDAVYMWSGGIAEIAKSTATTLSLKGYLADTTIAFNDNGASADTITDSNSNFLNNGFAVDDVITISGSTSNDGTYTIASVTAGTITLYPDDSLTTESAGDSVIIKKPNATWAEQGFLTAGTRKVRIGTTEYAYTGGETTGTLTGLSGVTGVNAGDIALQAVRTSNPTGLDGFQLGLIAVYNNHVFYGDLKSRVVSMSTDTDYTSFTKSSPQRAPGEGETFTLDSTPTAFIPDGEKDAFWISARKSDWYEVTFTLSADLTDESIRVRKLPTATGQGARSQSAIIRIKNATAFISFEPNIDTLGRLLAIDTPQSVAISDPIRDDLLTYDLTDVHGLFYQNQIFVCVPNENKVLIYDTEMGAWQPPQTLPISRLALIDINGDGTQVLCGHSSSGNETYELFTGYNDNGNPISVAMHFGYDNYGTRFTQKRFSDIASELYMSENTTVTTEEYYDYKGASGSVSYELKGTDTATKFAPAFDAGLGSAPLGSNPLGSLATPVDDLNKYRVINQAKFVNFFEKQRVFKAEGTDIRFAVIAYGNNAVISEDMPNFIKK